MSFEPSLPAGEDAPPTVMVRRLSAPVRVAGPAVVAPSRSDPVVRVASQVVGGPAGRRLASGRGFWRAGTVLILLSLVTLGFGVVQKQHCRHVGWSTPDQFWHACYSDIPVLYSSIGLGGPARPQLQQAVSGGSLGSPVQAAAMWGVSALVDDGNAKLAPRRFFDLSAIILGAALATTVALAVAVSGRRRWDAAHVALAPIVITAGLVSYELLAVALLTGGLVAWARRRPALAGILLGLATGVRPVASVVGLAVFVVALRAGRLRPFATMALAGGLTWLGLRLVLFPGYGAGLSGAWQSWKSAVPGYGSLWLVPQLLSQSRPAGTNWWYSGPALGASATTTAGLLGMITVAVVAVTLGLVAPDRPRLAHLALFTLAGFLLVAKSVPVQVSLLLLPLVALSGLRWRDHLIWAGAEVSYFLGTWLYIAGSSKPDRGLPVGFYLVLLLLRLAAIGWLAIQAARESLDATRDPVRLPEDGGPGRDDPLGGPVDEAPDALVVRLT